MSTPGERARRRGTALLAGVLLLLGCRREWRHAERFRSSLACGLQAEAVLAKAQELGASEWASLPGDGVADAPFTLVVSATTFDLWFGDGGLERYRQGRYHGLTGFRSSLRVNVCTGEVVAEPMLCIEAPSSLRGGTVLLDGELFGQLSSGPGERVGACGAVTLAEGRHVVTVSTEAHEPVRRELAYSTAAFWPQQEVLLEIAASEVRPRS
jgi:hypothetical protein